MIDPDKALEEENIGLKARKATPDAKPTDYIDPQPAKTYAGDFSADDEDV